MAKARNIIATGRFALAVDDDSWPYRGVSLWGSAQAADPAMVVSDLRAFMHDLAVSYLGAKLGEPMGESLSILLGPIPSSFSTRTGGATSTTRSERQPWRPREQGRSRRSSW
jgi:hypothetical protein